MFSAKVARVLPGADERTKRYTAFLDVDIDQALLVPDLTGEASIVIDRHENVLLAEQRAMLGHALFVVRDGVAHYVPVVIGHSGLKHTEVQSGVGEGDLVIVDSPAGFRDGQKVRVAREASR